MPLILPPITHWSSAGENLGAAWPGQAAAWGDSAAAAQLPRRDPAAAAQLGLLSQTIKKMEAKLYGHDGLLAPELILLRR